MNQEIAELGLAIMQELVLLAGEAAQAGEHAHTGVSAAKLCKRLGVRMSSVQRALAYFGESGMAESLGWVQAEQQDDRLILRLSAAGWAQVQLWQAASQTPQEAEQNAGKKTEQAGQTS